MGRRRLDPFDLGGADRAEGHPGRRGRQLAVAAGVSAIAVSNHGGRQLDGAPPALEVLPRVVEAVGSSIEIICDGGVRRGADIVKAVALGANACMAGRAYLYGLGAAGEAGVDHVLRLLDADVRRTMALCGVTSVAEITPELVRWRDRGTRGETGDS
jgi:L-lactate dehydrogenase (cytochrome)